jgi:hypothetical protein
MSHSRGPLVATDDQPDQWANIPPFTIGLLRSFIVTRFFMFFMRQPSTSEGVTGSRTGRGRWDWRSPVIGCAIILVAAGCSSDDVAPEAATETTVVATTSTTAAPDTTTTVVATTSTTAAPATTAAAPIEVPLPSDLTETYSIPNFGYSIDYPSGWFADTNEPNTQIVQIEEELFSDSDEKVGLGVNLDHRTVAFLQSIGLASDDPTAQDMVEFNTSEFGWTDVRDVEEVEIFGSPAIRVRATDSGGESVVYQGIRSDTGEVFAFSFGAPTDEILDEFLPTWDAMVDSITATE